MEEKKTASPFKPSKNKVAAKPNDRLERLREWQKARDDAKAKANLQTKKPVFAIRNNSKTSLASNNTTVFKPQYSTKKAILAASPKPVVKPPIARPPARPSTKVMEPPKKASRLTAPTRQSTRLASKQPVKKSVAPVTKATTSTKPAVSSKQSAPSSARTATKPTVTSKQTAPSSARSTTSTRPTMSSAVADKHAPGKAPARSIKAPAVKKGVVSTATKAVTGKATEKTAAVKRGKKSPTGKKQQKPASCDKTSSTGKRSKKSSAKVDSVEVDPVPTDIVVCALPVTPKKSYQPVHPSPLLKCHSATRQQEMLQQEPVSEYVNDPAWITGAPAPDDASVPSFDNVFGASFSPFQFTAGSGTGQDFQFKFQKDITEVLTAAEPVDVSQDSLEASESTFQPNSSHTSTDDQHVDDVIHSSSDGIQSGDDVALTSDSAAAAILEDLIIFSDASDHEEADSTPKLRRSARNVPRKCYSSTKRRKPAVTVDDSTTEAELTPVRAKKARTRRSTRIANMENAEGVVCTAEDEKGVVDPTSTGSSRNTEGATATSAEGVVDPTEHPTESSAPREETTTTNTVPTTTTMKVSSAHRSGRKKSRKSSRRESSALGVARNLEADYDNSSSENGGQGKGCE